MSYSWHAYCCVLLLLGDDKMRSGTDLRGASPLVSFNHVIDPSITLMEAPHFVVCRFFVCIVSSCGLNK